MLVALIAFPAASFAQSGHDHHKAPPAAKDPKNDNDRMIGMADHAMGHDHSDSIMSRHMYLSPAREATAADSAKARAVVADLRRAI